MRDGLMGFALLGLLDLSAPIPQARTAPNAFNQLGVYLEEPLKLYLNGRRLMNDGLCASSTTGREGVCKGE